MHNIKLFIAFLALAFILPLKAHSINPIGAPEKRISTDSPVKNSDLPSGIREKKSKNKIQGKQYIYENWQKMNISFDNSTIQLKEIPARVNIFDSTIEILHENRVKIISLNMVDKFGLADNPSLFITHKKLPIDSPEGFYRVIYNGNAKLLCYYFPVVINANYNRTLDIGINYDEADIKSNYYIQIGINLVKLKKNRKSLSQLFTNEPDVQNFIKSEHISPGNEFDLLKFVEFYDNKINN